MRTDEPSPPASAVGRLRHRADRARRWVVDLGPGARWGVGLVALTGLLLAGYQVATSEPSGSVWLYNDHKFARADAAKILDALALAKVPAIEDQGRIGVPLDRKTDALTALQKAKLQPRSIEEVRAEARDGSIWNAVDRDEQVKRERENILRALIGRFPGILSAHVVLSPTRPRTGLRPIRIVKATVAVQAEADRSLRPRTIQAIRDLLASVEPDLDPNGVTLLDSLGRSYLVADKPEVGARTLAEARGEELEARISDLLRQIEGIRVSVVFEATAAPMAAPATAMAANTPIGDETPKPMRDLTVSGRATVLVQVPNRYYLDSFRSRHPGRSPSREDLQPFVTKTEATIRAAVAHVVGEELGPLTIDRLEVPEPPRPTVATTPVESWRGRSWWPLAAVAGAAAALLMAVGGRWLASRRQAARPTRPGPRPHFDAADLAGPSERARELVRRDPEAAAGVLRRWIGGGGDDA